MKMISKHTLFIIISLCLVITMIISRESAYALQNRLSIEDVNIDREELSPGEEANISFRITGDSRITVLIYNSDYDVVRLLLDKEDRPAGTIIVKWDGTDDSGMIVPAEAYIPSIVAEDPDGQTAVYDPTEVSGGETLDIPVQEVRDEFGHYKISYSLPAPARVNIMAGIHNGPMLKTVMDWHPQPSGEHVRIWDGYDDTGKIDLTNNKNRTVYVTGFLFPENSLIVKGQGGIYKPASVGKAGRSQHANTISRQGVRKNIMRRSGKRISKQYMNPNRLNAAPRFKVYRKGDINTELAEAGDSLVSGVVSLSVEVSPESLDSFNESRYEIVVFADNERFDEEEQAYTPYTYNMDTTRFSNGEHWITINLLSLSGQVGSYSFKLDVRN